MELNRQNKEQSKQSSKWNKFIYWSSDSEIKSWLNKQINIVG